MTTAACFKLQKIITNIELFRLIKPLYKIKHLNSCGILMKLLLVLRRISMINFRSRAFMKPKNNAELW